MKDDTVGQPESFSDDPLTEIQLLGQAIEAEGRKPMPI